jgi:hypothetical protein
MFDDSPKLTATTHTVIRGGLCKSRSWRRGAWPDSINRAGATEEVLERAKERIVGSGKFHREIEREL